MQSKLLKIHDIIKFYSSKKLIFVFLMGIVSGIPLYLILSTMMIWLTRENIDIAKIGLFTLAQLPWSLKFLWAPVIDNNNIPIISKYFGKRKSWLLVTQFFLAFSIITLGFNDPNKYLLYTAIIAFAISFFSATQDIIIDAFRIELLDQELQGAGAAMTQAGYRIGGIIAGAGALYFREIISWKYVFVILGLTVFLFMFLTLLIPENREIKKDTKKNKKKRFNHYAFIFIEPLKEFLTRNKKKNTILILLFILLFKLGDVIAGVMANPFYVKIGFSNMEIANVSKLFGVIATLIGVFIGGYLVKVIGILRVLIIGGFLQILSNLLFVLLANVGPDYIFLIITVAGENISGGLGSAGFVAYLSILCNKKYTASQYALLSSFMGIARTIMSSPSGYLVNLMGWSNFFLISTIFGIPGVLILFWMLKNFKIQKQIVK
tara:strand:- start:10476 stop:11777 length:1302 start_codon:yes stop_codon:yes gene_type:complete